MRSRPLGATALIIAAAGSIPAAARDVTEGFSPEYQACITYGEAHGTTAIPALDCSARELRRQDARLNTSYKRLMARLSPARKTNLRIDERNWIIVRDQRCGARSDPNDRAECLIVETIKRVRYMDAVLLSGNRTRCLIPPTAHTV
jgi:uncharacterized protein YecT (DUF1311 family)